MCFLALRAFLPVFLPQVLVFFHNTQDLNMATTSSASATMYSAPTLDERIQALAQELQDIIFDYTVAIDTEVVTIDKDWKAPWQLQINRATRAKFSKVYYSHTRFNVNTDCNSVFTMDQWLDMLEDNHRAVI